MKAFEESSTQSKIIYLFIFCLAGLFLAGSLVTAINGFWSGQLMLSAWGLRLSSAIQMVLMFFMPAITLIVWSGQEPVSFRAQSLWRGSQFVDTGTCDIACINALYIIAHTNKSVVDIA